MHPPMEQDAPGRGCPESTSVGSADWVSLISSERFISMDRCISTWVSVQCFEGAGSLVLLPADVSLDYCTALSGNLIYCSWAAGKRPIPAFPQELQSSSVQEWTQVRHPRGNVHKCHPHLCQCHENNNGMMLEKYLFSFFSAEDYHRKKCGLRKA